VRQGGRKLACLQIFTESLKKQEILREALLQKDDQPMKIRRSAAAAAKAPARAG
jgi:hypothetical protein